MIRIERSPWDYRAMTAAGQAIATFDSPDTAARWAETEGNNWPGHRVERVRTTTTVEVIHRHAQAVAA